MDWKPIESAPRDGTEIIVRCSPKSISLGWWFAPSKLTFGWLDQNGEKINPIEWITMPKSSSPTTTKRSSPEERGWEAAETDLKSDPIVIEALERNG